MWFIPRLSPLKSSVGRRQKSRPSRNWRPVLEYLEDRRLLSSVLTETGVSPNSGPAPGAIVQVSGTGFVTGSKVFFNTALASFSGGQTSTLLTVVAPSLPIGSADVEVVNPDGQQAIILGAFFALPGNPTSPAPAPTITSVSPGAGPATGGTLVTISGTGFQAGSHVFFNGVAATISGTPTATSLTVVAPPLSPGAADVKVVNPDGQNALAAGAFVAMTASPAPAPTVTSIIPSSGPPAGGTSVQISGTGFQAGVKVFFNGLAATITGTPTDTAITVVTPALPLGAVDVKVVNPDGQQVLLTGAFLATSQPNMQPPNIMLVTPRFGPELGVVTITGSGFVPGASKVFFGNVPATLTGTQTATTLTVIVPIVPATGPTDIKIVNPDGKQAGLVGGFYALAPAPVITGISPNSGPAAGGTVVTISGSGFQTDSLVFIGGKPALAAGTPTATTLTVTTPALAVGPADVRITNPDGVTTVVRGGFTVGSNPSPLPPPVATSINPTSGPAAGGTTVTITGTGFQATSQVFFNGILATITGTPTATSLTVVTPPLSVGPADVEVLNPDGKQWLLPAAFTAQAPNPNPSPPPVTTGIKPTSGPPGTVVTISGTGFQATSQVFINGVAAPLSGTQTGTALTVVVPSLAPGTYDVKVVNPDAQQSVLTKAFTVLPAPPPVVNGVSPNSGAPGSTIQITGTGFQPGSKVFFGTTQATVSGTPTATLITVVIPNLPIGTVSLTVVNADGTQSMLPGGLFIL